MRSPSGDFMLAPKRECAAAAQPADPLSSGGDQHHSSILVASGILFSRLRHQFNIWWQIILLIKKPSKYCLLIGCFIDPKPCWNATHESPRHVA